MSYEVLSKGIAPHVQLTEEQKQIVNHTNGPAIVFAVAGSGKTTAMVARIARLVDEGIFEARHILATSFSRATVAAIKAKLRASSVRSEHVAVNTLHSVGYQTLCKARDFGLIDFIEPDKGDDNPAPIILTRALARARSLNRPYVAELQNMDREDFLNYVGSCKGNLQYANLEAAQLPDAARELATQAKAPANLAWYLDLYRLYEETRKEMKLVTFDDHILLGWELLFCHERVRAAIAGRWRCVIVDEFQDVNLAQSEMLDIITASHRNYMVIGDEDQTIYEWRGASPRFILDFQERYGAAKFLIPDNFRCFASHVALANRVIEHNTMREKKALSLTRGFEGQTYVQFGSGEDGARYIAAEVKAKLRERVIGQKRDHTYDDFAVLVRMYAQTPSIEQAFMQENIPYRVVGSQPFYKRREIACLLAYLRLMFVERRMKEGGDSLSASEVKRFRDDWNLVRNLPTRYISQEAAAKVAEDVVYKERPLSRVLSLAGINKHADKLALDLEWLVKTPPTMPAAQLLAELVFRTKYLEYWENSSAFREIGEGKAENVRAFLEFAKHQGTAEQLLAYIDDLMRRYPDEEDEDEPHVRIMTIFRAKGLEWPCVFVPGCNTGILPIGGSENIEEERRLMYVALTRSSGALHLLVHTGEKQSISYFLQQARYEETLRDVARIGKGVEGGLFDLPATESHAVRQGISELGLSRFFRLWWEDGAMSSQFEEWIAVSPPPVLPRQAPKIEVNRTVAPPAPPVSGRGPVAPPPAPMASRPVAPSVTSATSRGPISEGGLVIQAVPRQGTPAPKSVVPENVTRLKHSSFGEGTIVSILDGTGGTPIVVVRFDDADVGEKKLVATHSAITYIS